MPKISIILPLYNKAPYVTKALESIASQTYHDYEVIIVNDGSTDDSAAIVEQWLHENSCRCRLITQANAGVSAARNRGIDEANGEYLAFLDADDWWSPDFLEEMLGLTSQYPDAGLYAGNYTYYKPGKMRVGVKQVYDPDGCVHHEAGWSGVINYPKSYYENGEQVVWTGAVLMRKKCLESIAQPGEPKAYFPAHIQLGEDFLVWSQLALQYPVVFFNKPLSYYNNALPARFRLTQCLHAPANHMLWHMQHLPKTGDWKRLEDKLCVTGLLPYWLSDIYHVEAAQALAEVDWSNIPEKLAYSYRQPRWLVRIKLTIRRLLSTIKHQLVECNHEIEN